MTDFSTKMIPVEHLKSGMKLAIGVFNSAGTMLMAAGSVISSQTEAVRLKMNGISVVAIEVSSQEVSLPPSKPAKPKPPEPVSLPKGIASARELLQQVTKSVSELTSMVESGALVSFGPVANLGSHVARLARENPWLIPAMLREPPTSVEQVCVRATNIAGLTAAMAVELGMSERDAELLCSTVPLLDLGLVRTLKTLGSGRPIPATHKEVLNKHSKVSQKIASRLSGIPPVVLEAISQHHERLDGSGYPSGRAGDGICEFAQILGLADCYCTVSYTHLTLPTN